MVQKKEGATIAKAANDTQKAKSEKPVVKLNPDEQRIQKLSEQIEFFNKKHEILKKRNRFQLTGERLGESLKSIPNEDDQEFEKKEPFKMIISEGYNNTLCTISNPLVLRDIITEVMKKIEDRVFALDEELIS